MGFATNLMTANADKWPASLRFVPRMSWLLATLLILTYAFWAARIRFHGKPRRRSWFKDVNPYPGLSPYDQTRAAVFFGRRRETQELLDRYRDATSPLLRFIPVIGPSGVGKSSLVFAGLIPAIESTSAIVGPFSPANDTFGELARALSPERSGAGLYSLREAILAEAKAVLSCVQRDEAVPRPERFLQCLSQVRGRDRVVIVIDQLEEAAVLGGATERNALMALLIEALRIDKRLVVVATLRSEYLAPFQQGAAADLLRSPVVINVVGARAMREVITGPAEQAGINLEDGLADRIVSDATTGDALPMLSYLLWVLYADKHSGDIITHADYEAAGGVAGVIARRANAVLGNLTSEMNLGEGAAVAKVLDTLLVFVSVDGSEISRRPVGRRGFEDEQSLIIDRFLEARLLVTSNQRIDGEDNEQILNLAHEALIRQWPPLRDQIAVEEERLRRRTELEPLAHAWDRAGRRVDYLITGERLHEALQSLVSLEMPSLVIQFLRAGETTETEDLQRRADVAAHRALEFRAEDPEGSIALAYAAAVELAPTVAARFACYAALGTGFRDVLHIGERALALAWSDGGMLAAGCADGFVRVWDDAGEEELCVPSDHVRGLAWSRTGWLAVAADGGAVTVWNEQGEAKVWFGRTGRVHCVAWSPDGRLAGGSDDGTVRVWGAGGKGVRTLSEHTGRVWAVAWSTDGRLASASEDKTVRIWSAEGVPLRTLTGHTSRVWALSWCHDGRLAAASDDAVVRVWDPTGDSLAHLVGHTDWVRAVAFSHDGRLASASDDGSVRIWSRSNEALHIFAGHRGNVRALAWDSSGRIAAGDDTAIRFWGAAEEQIHVLRGHKGAVCSVAWSLDGHLATASDDMTVRIWSSIGERLLTLRGHASRIWSVAWSAGGESLATASADRSVRIWSKDGSHIRTLADQGGHEGMVCAVAWSPDGRLATGSADTTVRVWNSDGSLQHTLSGHGSRVWAVAWRSDGLLASGSADGTTRIWAPHGLLLQVITGHNRRVWSVAWSPDGRLATASADGTARIWTAEGQLLATLSGHSSDVNSVSWASDGRLATGSDDGTIRIWDSGGEHLHTLTRHGGRVWSVGWSRDNQLGSSSSDGTAVIWPSPSRVEDLIDKIGSCRGLRQLTAQERRDALLPPRKIT